MAKHDIQAFIFPSTDAHASEYVPRHWVSREWISGFNGSAGTAVVTQCEAALWTDSRYFLAAAEQLVGTPFQLMKMGQSDTPDIASWLTSELEAGNTVGLDGEVNSISDVNDLRTDMQTKGISLNTLLDPVKELWKDRPALPEVPVMLHSIEFAGETAENKIKRLRERLSALDTDAMIVSALDEVAWLLNLRGNDVPCNPVFVAYCCITPSAVTLYTDPMKISAEVLAYLNDRNIALRPYNKTLADLSELHDLHLLLTPQTNVLVTETVEKSNCVTFAPSPVATMKAIKNATEIEGFQHAMIRDGVAMVKFLRRLLPAVQAGGLTERGVDWMLTALRTGQGHFKGISFNTIAGYAAHGAIVHYEATPETDIELHPKGFLLLDSGAQYEDGTTDITRTIALGEPTEEEKRIYTLVLKGHIGLSSLKFPRGASGTQLDLAARRALWQEGYNFGHGTGHGVGSYLNVHEGPHQIRMNWMPAPIVENMTVTDEPGLYLPGRFGVRIENVLLATPYKETEFGKFLAFTPLTLCPIDTRPIDTSLLDETEVKWLNDYHALVYQKLLPHLELTDDKDWLRQATLPLKTVQHHLHKKQD